MNKVCSLPLKIVIAPAGFKESLSATAIADAIEQGLRQVWPDSTIVKLPIPDGGEGYTLAMVAATNGTFDYVQVTGPLGEPVMAPIGFLGNVATPTAVIEMAAAAGLSLIPRTQRNPLLSTTFGVGELIKLAMDRGAKRILLGCGDSGTSDAGAGMLSALGAKLLDHAGQAIPFGAQGLTTLATLDLSLLDPRLATVSIDAACNITNVLCGDNGVAQIYGPQKGADEDAVKIMAHGLELFAKLAQPYVAADANGYTPDLATMPGGGASGGLGAALVAILKGKLHSRFDMVFEHVPLDEALATADLVITAEGAIDFQTPLGKVPAEVARRARNHSIPCIGIAGTLGRDYAIVNDIGLDAVFSILEKPRTLDSAIQDAAQLLIAATTQIAHLIQVGVNLAQK